MNNQSNHAGVTGKFVKNGTPNEYTTITPFIVVSNPAEAISFYETVFNAKTESVTEFDYEGNKVIVHAEINFGNGFLQLGAANQEYKLVLPPENGAACYSMSIYVQDTDKTLALAIANGATVREPVTNFVSGDRYCSILDPNGIRWSIMSRIEDISKEESYRRVAEWSTGQ
ncbi:VOC family protein [Oceanobacillus sojae]|uniref:VOC family protein n=1 Tax=Oceanobacillus sojae TaxID=582851 RepID=UPI0009883731|nr:VOC family protein [Oceanobacillus sojae]